MRCDSDRVILCVWVLVKQLTSLTAAVGIAIAHPEYVVGVVSRHRPAALPQSMVVMTPGVKLLQGTDSLGQNYITPEEVYIHSISHSLPLSLSCSHTYIHTHTLSLTHSQNPSPPLPPPPTLYPSGYR